MADKDAGGNADNNDKDKSGAGGGGNSGAGSGGAGGGSQGGGAGSGSGPKTYTEDEHKSAIEAAVAADRLAQRKTAKTKTAKTSAAGKGKHADEEEESPELVKARERADQAEAQLRQRDSRDAVERAAKDAGFGNPGKIYRLIKDDLSFDDSGKPDNVKDLITVAKRDFPEELSGKGVGSADAGAGSRSSGAGSTTNMNDFIRRAAGRG